MRAFSLKQFAHFIVREINLETAQKAGLEAAAQIVQAEAKRVIGTYDYGWKPLKEATIARKTTGDSPLLETGELRDSIEYIVLSDHEAAVGSNNDKAVWHELGTRTIPPRSFLAGAAAEKAPEVSKVIGLAVASAIASRNVDVAIAKLAIDAVKHLAHDIREMIPDEDGEHQQKH
jgi:phage gpG-like protein